MCSNWFSDILWGGMQWQLEHHLFPTMPRYRYPALSKVIQEFAAEHGLSYRSVDEVELVKRNWRLMRDVAAADPLPGAPDSTPKFKLI